MGLLGALAHRGERAWAGQAMLAQRPDADFQGGKPAPLTCSKMPALLNGEQLGQFELLPVPGRHCEPSTPATVMPLLPAALPFLGSILHSGLQGLWTALSCVPLVLRGSLSSPVEKIASILPTPPPTPPPKKNPN